MGVLEEATETLHHDSCSLDISGLPRLSNFYTPIDLPIQQKLINQIHGLVVNRSDTECNFLTPPPLLLGNGGGDNEEDDDIKVIYRHYATLYFVFVVDDQESELGILDLIQVFVESLDRCFDNVCELDLVFGWQVLNVVVNEIIQGGMVVETNINHIVEAVEEANNFSTNIIPSTSPFAAFARGNI